MEAIKLCLESASCVSFQHVSGLGPLLVPDRKIETRVGCYFFIRQPLHPVSLISVYSWISLSLIIIPSK